jgi:hypothetical protein
LSDVRPGTAVILGATGIALMGAGAVSISYASSLDRSQRPPFIQFGLAALAVALVSAHPLAVAIQRYRR